MTKGQKDIGTTGDRDKWIKGKSKRTKGQKTKGK